MDKVFNHTIHEDGIYKMWEESGVFTPKIDKPPTSSSLTRLRGAQEKTLRAKGSTSRMPFTIILPLPNANDPMHMGHALFTVEDIMIRFHMMRGDPTLWLPGGDHAGIETQFVFEKHLSKQGKSRFDYDRETLYKMIWEFAQQNKDLNKNQMKRLGFAMDWSRYHYSLEPEIVSTVVETFRKLHGDGLVYRGKRLVNYCTKCGTAFSDLEVKFVKQKDFLYYLDYGSIKIATTRPETIFADVAVAVNPNDKRYKKLVGKSATIPLINVEIPIISYEEIDKDFGTGALKVTPAHDELDWEIGIRNDLEVINIFDTRGFLVKHPRVPKNLRGLKVSTAREKTIELLENSGKLIKKDEIIHNVGTCYKCGRVIEPMLIPQWFVKTKPLAKKAIEAVKKGRTKIFPKKRFEKLYFDWMENIKDWNISRQIIWGPRIPVWYCLVCNTDITVNFINKKGEKIFGDYKTLSDTYTFDEIKKGLQSLSASETSTYQPQDGKCKKCGSTHTLQETDTFDTWFLSGQWPLTTLGFNVPNPEKSSEDFKYFYPTSVLDTLWDILFFWVGRMIMFGLYLTDEVPFKVVHIHARVVDKNGAKMSKSKGNVVDPIEMVDKYGADALRMALVVGVAPASDIAISEDKIRAQRNFANKLWNVARFVQMNLENAGVKKYSDLPSYETGLKDLTADDKKIIEKLEKLIVFTTKGIGAYKFGLVAERLYQFVWHEFADVYIESVKERLQRKDKNALIVLRHLLINVLKLLHPFMPFVTETIWQEIKTDGFWDEMLIQSKWPEVE